MSDHTSRTVRRTRAWSCRPCLKNCFRISAGVGRKGWWVVNFISCKRAGVGELGSPPLHHNRSLSLQSLPAVQWEAMDITESCPAPAQMSAKPNICRYSTAGRGQLDLALREGLDRGLDEHPFSARSLFLFCACLLKTLRTQPVWLPCPMGGHFPGTSNRERPNPVPHGESTAHVHPPTPCPSEYIRLY